MADNAQAPQQGGGKSGLVVLIVIVGLVVGGLVLLQKKAAKDAQEALVAGKAAFEAKKWEEAYTLLEKGTRMVDDADAKAKATEARKNHREALVAEASSTKDPEAALALLEKANAVSADAALTAKLAVARAGHFVAVAKKALDAGKVGEAVAAIGSAEGSQKGSSATLKDALYDAASKCNEDLDALAAFRALGAHKDAPDKLAALQTKLYGGAKDALHRGDLARAKTLLLALGDYKDSAKLLAETSARAGTPKAAWKQVGATGAYKGTKLLVALDGACWSVDGGGTLWRTDPSGTKKQVGKGGTWQKTVALVAMDGLLYSVEKDGTVYRTDKTGKFDEIGKGTFGSVRALIGLDGSLYSLEGGDLFKTEVATWKWQAVGGRNDWKDSRILCGFKGKIWSVEGPSGALFRTKPNGNFEKVGKDGDWKDTEWMVAAGDFIYSVEKNGTLYRTDAAGASKQVGDEGGFKDTVGVAAEGAAVWTIETDGTLYRTEIKSD